MRYIVLGMVLVGLCCNVVVEEAVSAPKHNTLKGLPGVYVLVNPIGSSAQKDGLTESSIQTAVERILRSKGVPILTREQRSRSRSAPSLHVRANTLKSSSKPLYAVTVEVSLHQRVALIHTPKPEQVEAATWSILSTGIYPQSNLKSLISEGIEVLIKRFANDYLTVNPKESKAQKPHSAAVSTVAQREVRGRVPASV